MRRRSLLLSTAAVTVLALPAAGAAPPNDEVARLKREARALKAQVRTLRAEVRALGAANSSSQRRERALARRNAAVDPCPITRANGSRPPGSGVDRNLIAKKDYQDDNKDDEKHIHQ